MIASRLLRAMLCAVFGHRWQEIHHTLMRMPRFRQCTRCGLGQQSMCHPHVWSYPFSDDGGRTTKRRCLYCNTDKNS